MILGKPGVFICDEANPAAALHQRGCGCCSPSRRNFLLGASAAATALAMLNLLRAAHADTRGSVIDVHHHLFPPKYLEATRDAHIKFSPGFARIVKWTPEQSIEEMDRNGVATSIVSIAPPGFWDRTQVERSIRIAREVNEYGAGMVAKYPGRFRLFAALPLPATDASLKEAEYALDVLKADGIGLLSNYDSKWPGHPSFAPVLNELNRRKAIVYFHPTASLCCYNLVQNVPTPLLELLFDSTRAIASLIYSGTLNRCPDLTIIFSHGGGTMPMVADRIATLARRNKKMAALVPKGVEYELARMHYDIASVTNVPAFSALQKVVPVSHLMFGTDYPYLGTAIRLKELNDLGLSDADLAAIKRGNAMKLIPSLNR